MHRLICNDFMQTNLGKFDCAFADVPDNLGLQYAGVFDAYPEPVYLDMLWNWINKLAASSNIVWLSFNARYTFKVGSMFDKFLSSNPDWSAKPCVQTFTFDQHNYHDLGNGHRPLWRLMHKTAVLYPDQIRVKSWRQQHGDPRADPRGRVPRDVFDFPRVTGNSRQKRQWHETQLNEGLVARCVLFSTAPNGTVLDPFGGTATTLRVCKGYHRQATLIELSPDYCNEISKEHCMTQVSPTEWELPEAKAWWLT